MKKRHIYNEFQRIAKEVVGECRKAQKYYVMQMCEQLGKVDHKQPFVLWCSKKRCLAYQSGMQEPPKPIANTIRGAYYLFSNSSDMAIKVMIGDDLTSDELAFQRYLKGQYTYQDYLDVCEN